MLRQDFNRIDPKRRNVLDHRKKQFATPQYKDLDYPHRLNFYADAPTADITLEQFEQWAIDRLRVLAELEACSFRNKTPAETKAHMMPILDKFLPLETNSSGSTKMFAQRQKDHYSHFILRLAFASTEDLRRRFSRVETTLFRMRFNNDDLAERSAFVGGLDLDWWESVTEDEKHEYAAELAAMTIGRKGGAEDETWFKVDWDRVPELIEGRRVFVRAGKAFVPGREQSSMVVAEFTSRLDRQLELTARALPRLDEDDRLTPILNHLSKNFITPDSSYMSGTSAPPGAQITAANVDSLSQHFPACMSHLHRSLRRDAHLKHFGRLQYSLFLKGIGLNLEECLMFWRSSFSKVTDDTFNKEYRYNIRHVYGDVGGDSNRRGGGYSPFSCQKILTEHPPGPGEAHGCPYRHFNLENLNALVQSMGVSDRSVMQGIKEDKDKQKFHMACNRVFEHLHKAEIRKAKDEGVMSQSQLETIVHPNEYFKRSYLLKNLGKETDVKMEG
ncbi:eukaryotic and archaeal DNA primase, large subunit-domain-containing protein [Ilyonectria robusta]|uniref:eukaryotic and archaeal DNA primase, large subunit-domain-containing protein n=1 Tax=Ilyonectria robusta TaxID=1079257 RepID=UPI001E8CCF7D|nr:eukaryotic and archaeal DNA primase, large subunit-domain-containing protein [Ilyonectria robusta]KAH8661223.1 eukaryotic and archaeal DNA primase, large subunit-domain-containing protein [Ilyonectria robusta]